MTYILMPGLDNQTSPGQVTFTVGQVTMSRRPSAGYCLFSVGQVS